MAEPTLAEIEEMYERGAKWIRDRIKSYDASLLAEPIKLAPQNRSSAIVFACGGGQHPSDEAN